MPDCPYYEIHRRTHQSREKSPQLASLLVVNIPWCAHPRSKSPRNVATRVLGRMLNCEGDRARCQLSPEEFADI